MAVVAGGGWVVSRPHPGDWIPGLGPSSADVSTTPPVVGNPLPPTDADPEALTADRYFPAQRTVEMGGYKGRRNGARQGQDCAETLRAREVDPLHDSGCQGYVTVSFSGVDRPALLSSVTVLRFADDVSAEKAARALRAQQGGAGALAFILPDASAAPAPAAGARTVPAERVEAVGHYLTVTASRLADARAVSPSGSASAPAATASPAAGPSAEQQLDEATRAVSYAAGAQFTWT